MKVICMHPNLYTMVIGFLNFVMTPNCKQPKYPSVRCKMLHPYHISFLAIKRNEVRDMPQHRYTSKTCQVKEVNHKRPHTVWLHLYEISRKGKSIQLESRFMITWGQGWGKWLQRNVIEFWSNGNISSQMWWFIHTHICQNSLTPHTKLMNFIMCKLYPVSYIFRFFKCQAEPIFLQNHNIVILLHPQLSSFWEFYLPMSVQSIVNPHTEVTKNTGTQVGGKKS